VKIRIRIHWTFAASDSILNRMDYGVLKGTVVDFGREDQGSSPHFQVSVQADNKRFTVPVNVKSTDGSTVLFSIVEPLANHRMIAVLPLLAEGFTRRGATGTAFLDYVREPMFDITTMRTLPPSVSGPDNDLQDFIAHKVQVAKDEGRLMFAFGSQFPGGAHDIHMNQGNPAGGRFAGDNAIHQDGGLIIETGLNSFSGIFLAFQTQLIPTDDHGMPLPNAHKITAGDPGGNTASQAADLSIVGACVNPLGADTAKETVILLNTSPDPADLSAFAIEDQNRQRERLQGTLAGGDARKITLSGQGAQLGNDGGSIRIVRLADGGIVHAVTYTAQGSDVQGRTLVF
jgi:uncharacterized protein YukJ